MAVPGAATWASSAKQKPEQKAQEQEKKTADPTDEFRKEWWKMRKGDRKTTGYHVYVIRNTDKIKYFCSENDFILRQMVDKYENVYGENWPLDKNFKVVFLNSMDGIPKETEADSIQEGEKTESRGSQDGSESISMTELMQTDEWQEFAMLQDKYPDAY